MMLGIAASSSIAVPSGRLSQSGDSSVRNKAIPKLTGTPIRSAMKEVTSVPTIGTSAPNRSVTGFHSESTRNPKPNFCIAGKLPYTSEMMIPSRITRTKTAKNRATALKMTSWSWTLFCFGSCISATLGSGRERGAPIIVAGIAAVGMTVTDGARSRQLPRRRSIYRLPGSVLDLCLPGVLDLAGDGARKRNVVERIRELFAVGGIRPVEELQHFPGRIGLRLRLVHEDERGAGNRPGILAGLVGQHQVVAGRLVPVRARGRRLERFRRGAHKVALAVLHLGIGHLVLQRVGV